MITGHPCSCFLRICSSSLQAANPFIIPNLSPGNIAGDCITYRDMIVDLGAVAPLLAQVHYALAQPNASALAMLRNASWSLSNLFRGKPRPAFQRIEAAIPVVRQLLFVNDKEVKIEGGFECVRVLANGGRHLVAV